MTSPYLGKKQGKHAWVLRISREGCQRSLARLSSSLNQSGTSCHIDVDEFTIVGPRGTINVQWGDADGGCMVTVWADPEMQSMAETIVVDAFLKEGGEPFQQSGR